jgi:hypothetical protein
MVEKVEVSPNNRAKCRYCGEKIGKGEPRGIFYDTYTVGGNIHPTIKYYCYKCAKTKIKEQLTKALTLQQNLRMMIKDCQKAILVNNL